MNFHVPILLKKKLVLSMSFHQMPFTCERQKETARKKLFTYPIFPVVPQVREEKRLHDDAVGSTGFSAAVGSSGPAPMRSASTCRQHPVMGVHGVADNDMIWKGSINLFIFR